MLDHNLSIEFNENTQNDVNHSNQTFDLFSKMSRGSFLAPLERTLHGCPCTQLKRERKPSAAQQRLAFFISASLAEVNFARCRK
jgi:hypothetical protein